MTEQNTATPKPEGEQKATETKPQPDTLGEGGKKALESERSARQKAETDLKALRGEFDGFKQSLSEAFGVKSSTDGDGDAIQQVQQQLNQVQHESLVYRLAAEHRITDQDDIDLLKAATAEQAPKLAGRLAAKAEAETKPGTPKPDATQGGTGSSTPVTSGPGEDFANFLNAQMGA